MTDVTSTPAPPPTALNGNAASAPPRAPQPQQQPPRPAASEHEPGGLRGLIARRSADWSLEGANPGRLERAFWSFACDHYFRLETDGWHRLPEEPCLLIGVHSGGSLTMDAWTLVFEWHRRFGAERVLHGTAHDVLMATPGLGEYFRSNGVIPASRESVTAALGAGHDVVVWPGGEQDAMRSWRKRDTAVLAGRHGFVKQAMRSGVPIVPVATVGGHDTVFVLSEGRFLARASGLGKVLRGATMPIVAGLPFGIGIEMLPIHVPLPAKIRTELLDPIAVDADRIDDREYVHSVYLDVERAIQKGMDRLAKRRSFPVFG